MWFSIQKDSSYSDFQLHTKAEGVSWDKTKTKNLIYSSVTDAIHPFSVVSVVEDLTHDWSQHNKHSRHVLGVRGFMSLSVIDHNRDV